MDSKINILLDKREYESFTLPNGIRIIHKFDSSPVVYCGLIINTGSRDELPHEHGIAHFIEHAIFKGTSKRNAYQINSCMDDVGGDINAYTTKEETCIYAIFLDHYFAKGIELISDIVFHSTFPKKELEKEKSVIFDEINSYKDSPSELIFDDFEELIFPNHPIGKNILGNPALMKKFSSKDIIQFMNRNYSTHEMVFSSVGNISFSKVKQLALKFFGQIPESIRQFTRIAPTNYIPTQQELKKKTFQTHCIIGCTAYSFKNEKNRVGLTLLNNILAGPSLNSRLSLSLREKHGYAYNIESGFTAFTDTGIESIYFGTDKKYFDKCLGLIDKELRILKTKKLGVIQLSKAKKQLTGQIAIASENKESLMMSFGKSYLHFNKVDSLQEIYHKIEAVTSDQLIEIANEIFDAKSFSKLVYH